MADQSDAALTAVELFRAITTALGENTPDNEDALLRLYDQCLQHVGYSNLNRQNDMSRATNAPRRPAE